MYLTIRRIFNDMNDIRKHHAFLTKYLAVSENFTVYKTWERLPWERSVDMGAQA